MKNKFYLVQAAGLILLGTAGLGQPDMVRHSNWQYAGLDRAKIGFSQVYLNDHGGAACGVCLRGPADLDQPPEFDKAHPGIPGRSGQQKVVHECGKCLLNCGLNKKAPHEAANRRAFTEKENAKAYINTNGGRIVRFEKAMQAVYDDMPTHTLMNRGKLQVTCMHKKNWKK